MSLQFQPICVSTYPGRAHRYNALTMGTQIVGAPMVGLYPFKESPSKSPDVTDQWGSRVVHEDERRGAHCARSIFNDGAAEWHRNKVKFRYAMCLWFS